LSGFGRILTDVLDRFERGESSIARNVCH
jgi:hypothetical protein